MQAAGLVPRDAKPDPDGEFTVECDVLVAGWCRARAHNLRKDDVDRALAFVIAAATIEAALGIRPPDHL